MAVPKVNVRPKTRAQLEKICKAKRYGTLLNTLEAIVQDEFERLKRPAAA